MGNNKPWPDRPMAERSLRVAMTGYVHDDDPTIIADMQQELDRVHQAIRAAENDAIERAAKVADERVRTWRSPSPYPGTRVPEEAVASVCENVAAAIRALKQPETRG